MKKTIIAILALIALAAVSSVGGTNLSVVTSKIGKEDIEWGNGTDAATFTAPTGSGGSVSLTKLPDLDADDHSTIKGVWYVTTSTDVADHSSLTSPGSVAWIDSYMTTNGLSGTVVFPPDKSYVFADDFNFNESNVKFILIRGGSSLAPAVGKTVDLTGVGIIAESPSWAAGAGTVSYSSAATVYVSGVTEEIAVNAASIIALGNTFDATIAYSNGGLYYSSNHTTSMTTADTYYVVKQWDGTMPATSGFSINATNGTITAGTAGVGTHEVQATGSFSYAATETLYAAAHLTRGSTIYDLSAYGCGFRTELDAGNYKRGGSLGCLYTLQSSDVLDFRVKGSASGSVTFYNLGFYVRR